MRTALACLAVALGAATACTSEPAAHPVPLFSSPGPTVGSPHPSPEGPTPAFDRDRALRHVGALAGRIGPRLATGPAFRAAADYGAQRLRAAGYAVRRQGFPVPAGDSWGVPVEGGRSFNVIAVPAGYDPGSPYVVVGAHLDTVAAAPGAEDNASGVAVVLELARTLPRTGPQVVLVLFGGEEPRGPGDLHHFGSRRYVARMTPEERRNLVAMVSLDRVGVGRTVPLYAVDGGPTDVRDQLERAGARAGVPTVVGTNTGSDHESFADAGLPAARVGGTSYAAYHSAADRPGAVDRAQLARVGRLLTEWLGGRTPGR